MGKPKEPENILFKPWRLNLVINGWREVVMMILLLVLIGLQLHGSIKMRSNLETAAKYTDFLEQGLWILEERLLALEQSRPELMFIEARIKHLQPKLDPAIRQQIAYEIGYASEKYKISPSLILHLIYQETGPKFDPLSTSPKGAVGLMQIMYSIHKEEIPELAKLSQKELYFIHNNLKFGCQILKKYIDSTKSLSEALSRYHGKNSDSYRNSIYSLMAGYEQWKWQKREDLS